MANNSRTLQINISANAKNLKASVDEAISSFSSMDKSTMSVKKSLRMLTQEATNYMAQYRALTNAERQSPFGQEIQRQIQELINQAGILQDTLGDTRNAIKQQASDTLYWDAAAQSMDIAKSGIEAFVAATMGADTESKKFKETMARLAQVETTFNTVIKITNALQKDSALMQALAKAKTDLATLAITYQTKALAAHRLAAIKGTAASKALSLAMSTIPVVAIVAALAAIAAAIYAISQSSADSEAAIEKFNEKLAAMDAAQKNLEESSRNVANQVIEEKIKIKALHDTVNNANIAYQDRIKALDNLKSKVPEYHANLTKEGKLINDNAVALDNYVTKLETAARKQIALSRVVNAELEISKQEVAKQAAQAQYDAAEDAYAKEFDIKKGDGFLERVKKAYKRSFNAYADSLVDTMDASRTKIAESNAIIDSLEANLPQWKKELQEIGFSEDFAIKTPTKPTTKPTAKTDAQTEKVLNAYEKQKELVDKLAKQIEDLTPPRNQAEQKQIDELSKQYVKAKNILDDWSKLIDIYKSDYPNGLEKELLGIVMGNDKMDFSLSSFFPEMAIPPLTKYEQELKKLEDIKEHTSKEFDNYKNKMVALQDKEDSDPTLKWLKEQLKRNDIDATLRQALQERKDAAEKVYSDNNIELLRKYGADNTELMTRAEAAYSKAQKELDKLRADKYFKDTKNEAIQGTIDGIGNIVGTIQSLKSEWESLSDIDNPFEQVLSSIMAVVDTVSGIYSFIQAIQGIIEIFQALTAAREAKAAAEAAAAPAEVAAQLATAEAERIRTATENTAAYAAIPFVGPSLAATAQGIYEGLWAAAAIPMFSNGGVFQGRTGLGDLNLARVNDGELILNGTQQGRLFRLLNGNSYLAESGTNGKVEFVIEGRNLRGVLKNSDSIKNKI